MVNVLAFYYDDPSSNPAECTIFILSIFFKRTITNEKEAGNGSFKNNFNYHEDCSI